MKNEIVQLKLLSNQFSLVLNDYIGPSKIYLKCVLGYIWKKNLKYCQRPNCVVNNMSNHQKQVLHTLVKYAASRNWIFTLKALNNVSSSPNISTDGTVLQGNSLYVGGANFFHVLCCPRNSYSWSEQQISNFWHRSIRFSTSISCTCT